MGGQAAFLVFAAGSAQADPWPSQAVPGLFGCWISPALDGLGGKFHGP